MSNPFRSIQGGAKKSNPHTGATQKDIQVATVAIMAIQPALVRSIYPKAMLGRGLGFNTTVVATSLAAGPSLGAALLSIASWPIPIASAATRMRSGLRLCRR